MIKNEKDKQKILLICNRLKNQGFITEIEEEKYSVKIFIKTDGKYERITYDIRDRIKRRFNDMGYSVEILGPYWLEITYYDVDSIIDECFNVGDD